MCSSSAPPSTTLPDPGDSLVAAVRFPVHMAERILVTDVDDPRLVDYRSLKDTELRKRYENQAGVFIAEGPNVVLELLSSRFPTRSLLLSPEMI